MQKPNEVSIGTDDHMRSRNLFNPTDSVKVMAGYLNKVFIMIDKVLTKEFIHGMNTGKLEECMQQDIPMFQDLTMMSYDGSSYDAHQHISLIEAVDF
jgi:hypothetical protein